MAKYKLGSTLSTGRRLAMCIDPMDRGATKPQIELALPRPYFEHSQGLPKMIRHIVLFSVKNPADRELVRSRLLQLGDIPGSSNFEVTANLKVDKFDNSIDIVVYSEFESVEALAAYKAHPTYAEITATVRPLRELRFAADVEAAEQAVAAKSKAA